MKSALLMLVASCLALSLRAQVPALTYSPEQLDQLLGPVALYPDPLIAVLLPASTVPGDIALAAGYLAANGAPGGIDAQPWDPSVKALARYPAVVKWMNDNLDWTQALGAAFAQQPAEVMKSVQQLRAQARAAGSLVDTPQQVLDIQGDDIRIIPARPDTIYVPEYDPGIVYQRQVTYAGPLLTFGLGFPVGIWLGYQCDWDDFGIWMGPWSPGWSYRRGWRDPGFGRGAWRSWRPDPYRSREAVRNFYRPEGRLPRPAIIAGYRGPARRPGELPGAPIFRADSRLDFRGRTLAPPQPSAPARVSPLLGGYNRGAPTRDASNRGQSSRAAPVRPLPAPRIATPPRSSIPARPSAPPARGGPPPRPQPGSRGHR